MFFFRYESLLKYLVACNKKQTKKMRAILFHRPVHPILYIIRKKVKWPSLTSTWPRVLIFSDLFMYPKWCRKPPSTLQNSKIFSKWLTLMYSPCTHCHCTENLCTFFSFLLATTWDAHLQLCWVLFIIIYYSILHGRRHAGFSPDPPRTDGLAFIIHYHLLSWMAGGTAQGVDIAGNCL
jgi:hypothetical protein